MHRFEHIRGSGNTSMSWNGDDGPWGRRSGRSSGGSEGSPQGPDMEDVLRHGREKMKSFFSKSRLPGKGLVPLLVILLVVWLGSGFYRVNSNEEGLVLRFGRWIETTQPGLNWHIPWPIESVLTPGVTDIKQIDIGYRDTGSSSRQRRDVIEESLMLTGDQNIIDIDFAVLWKISDAGRFLFQIRDPEATIKIAAESAMREVIGRTDIQPALTEERENIQRRVRLLLQDILDEYEAGIEIVELNMQDVQPPQPVIDAFDDVQRAIQDRDRARNVAESYRNDILPRARGEAQAVLQNSQAYREQKINQARGDADRFLSVYAAYRENPHIARKRMYLETMQEVLGQSEKIILDQEDGGVLPYLPLDRLRSRK